MEQHFNELVACCERTTQFIRYSSTFIIDPIPFLKITAILVVIFLYLFYKQYFQFFIPYVIYNLKVYQIKIRIFKWIWLFPTYYSAVCVYFDRHKRYGKKLATWRKPVEYFQGTRSAKLTYPCLIPRKVNAVLYLRLGHATILNARTLRAQQYISALTFLSSHQCTCTCVEDTHSLNDWQ